MDTETGFNMVLAAMAFFCSVMSCCTKVVKLGCPRTTSAAAPLAVGMRL